MAFGRFLKNRKGNAIVEIALILPILILIVCVVLELANVISDKSVCQSAAAEGCRKACVNGGFDRQTADKPYANDTARQRVDYIMEENGVSPYEVEASRNSSYIPGSTTWEHMNWIEVDISYMYEPVSGYFGAITGNEVDIHGWSYGWNEFD